MFFRNSMRSYATAALAVLMLGAAPSALFAKTPADTLVIADAIDEIISLDPGEAYEPTGIDLNNNLYDGLIEIDPVTLKLVPGLAESWSVSDDGMTFTFKMRPGVTFSSGNPVTAKAAAWSFQRAIKMNGSPSFILSQFGWKPDNVEKMVVADGDKLVLKTDKPYAPTFFYTCLTAGVAEIVDEDTAMQHEVNGDLGNAWLKANSAGTGAYVLKSFKPKESYFLEARKGHWRGDAKTPKIYVQHVPEPATERLLLEKGDVDVARVLSPVDLAGLQGNPDVKIQQDLGAEVYYMAFNQKNEQYKNPKLLEAMRWAVDYQGIADTILKGTVVAHQNFLPTGYIGALDDLPYHLDIEKAKELVKESGIENPQIRLSLRNSPDRMDAAQSIQNTFAQAGITVKLDVGDGDEKAKEYRGRQHDGELNTWLADFPDSSNLASAFAENPDPTGVSNAVGYLSWRNSWDPGELSAKVQAAVLEKDPAKRAAIYEEIQRVHRATSPYIVMFQRTRKTGLRSNVNGFYTGAAIDAVAYWLATK